MKRAIKKTKKSCTYKKIKNREILSKNSRKISKDHMKIKKFCEKSKIIKRTQTYRTYIFASDILLEKYKGQVADFN